MHLYYIYIFDSRIHMCFGEKNRLHAYTKANYHVSGHMHARLCTRVLLQCDFRIKSERQRKTEKQISLLSDIQITFFYVQICMCLGEWIAHHVTGRNPRPWSSRIAFRQRATKQDATHEPECTHIKHVSEIDFYPSIVPLWPYQCAADCAMWKRAGCKMWSAVCKI